MQALILNHFELLGAGRGANTSIADVELADLPDHLTAPPRHLIAVINPTTAKVLVGPAAFVGQVVPLAVLSTVLLAAGALERAEVARGLAEADALAKQRTNGAAPDVS